MVENKLQIFNSEEFGNIRVVEINKEPCFVGKDVAEILGYKDTADALKKHVDDEDKLTLQIADSGQNRSMIGINESGLYGLILSSKLSGAKKFKRWVTSEVLPSIRKHSTYMTEEVIEKTLTDPDFIIKLATQLKEERIKRIEVENIVQEQKPLVEGYNQFIRTENLLHWDTVAKNLKIGRNTLLRLLRENGILITNEYYYKGEKHYGENHNVPYQAYMKYFDVKYTTIKNTNKRKATTLVTAKGQEYLAKKIKEYVEQN